MACMYRFSSYIILRHTRRIPFSINTFATEANQAETPADEKPEPENDTAFSTEPIETHTTPQQNFNDSDNGITFAGIVTRANPNQSPFAFTIQHYANVKLRVVSPPSRKKMDKKLWNIEEGMNVFVQGYLAQNEVVRKVRDQFLPAREAVIVAEKVEVLTTQEDVERKYDERRERILSNKKQESR